MRISDWSSDVCSSDLIILVEPVAVGEAQEIPVRDRRPPDDVRRSIVQPGAVGEQAGLVGQSIAFPDVAVYVEPRTAVIPFDSLGDARSVLYPVVTFEPVDLYLFSFLFFYFSLLFFLFFPFLFF